MDVVYFVVAYFDHLFQRTEDEQHIIVLYNACVSTYVLPPYYIVLSKVHENLV